MLLWTESASEEIAGPVSVGELFIHSSVALFVGGIGFPAEEFEKPFLEPKYGAIMSADDELKEDDADDDEESKLARLCDGLPVLLEVCDDGSPTDGIDESEHMEEGVELLGGVAPRDVSGGAKTEAAGTAASPWEFPTEFVSSGLRVLTPESVSAFVASEGMFKGLEPLLDDV